MAEPKFSVSEITTFHQTFDEDLATYREAGVEGVGVWEFKLPEGDDAETVAKLKDCGLKATTCIPGTLSIYPVPFPGPTDPAERTEGLCAAIRRFAPFEPEVVLCLTGHPGDTDPAEARQVIVEGLRQAAKVAGEYGLTLGIEPLHRKIYGTWTTVGDDPRTIDLMDEIGEPEREAPVRRLPPVRHRQRARRHRAIRQPDLADVHICDWRGRDPQRLRPRAARATGSSISRRSSARSKRAVSPAGSISRSSPTTARSATWTSRTRSGSRIRSTSSVGRRRASTKAWAARRPRDGLAGKVALVTGAAHERGIGRGMVLALADEGCAVAINDVGFDEMGEELAELVRGMGAGPSSEANVAERAEVDDLVARVEDELGAARRSPARTRASPTGRTGRRYRRGARPHRRRQPDRRVQRRPGGRAGDGLAG